MASLVQDMSVDHGRADIFVTEEFLNRANVVACFEQMRGEGVSERIGSWRA